MAINPTRALSRSIGVARLNVPTIEEVEADTSSTDEAGAVVVVAAILGSLGALFVNGLWGFIGWILVLICGWFLWAWISAFIAKRLFNVATTDTGEMLRTMGYASAPRAIGIIPFLGFLGFIWSLVAVVIGVRQAGEMSTGQAIITVVVGAIPTLIGMSIITAILL